MNKDITDILLEVTETTLKQLAFLFCSPEPERNKTSVDMSIGALIHFSGQFNGAIVLVLSMPILIELTGNMLGIEEDEVTVTHQYDALKETLNVICGNLLPFMAGEKEMFHISSPEVIINMDELKKAITHINGLSLISIARMHIETEQCDLFLFLDDNYLKEKE